MIPSEGLDASTIKFTRSSDSATLEAGCRASACPSSLLYSGTLSGIGGGIFKKAGDAPRQYSSFQVFLVPLSSHDLRGAFEQRKRTHGWNLRWKIICSSERRWTLP